jgi:catechol 2,3-dioxygenase-like lactoylglutathione lyase family enzyme
MTSGPIKSVDQVAVVVRNLDEAMRRYSDELDIAPWSVYTFTPEWVHEMTFRGREQPYSMKLALAQVGETMYELIEPLDGPNTYREFLDERGEGLHHLGFFVEDLDATIREMQDKGFAVLQSGRGFGVDGDGGYAYFETDGALGCIVEAIELPGAPPDPERTYPA